MPMKFKIRQGKGAIYSVGPGGDAPLTDPNNNMDLLKWHNELEHIGIVEIRDYTVTLPQSNSFSPPRQATYVLDQHDQPSTPFVYGYATVGGSRRPFAMHAFVSMVVRPTELAGIQPHASERMVSLGVDGPNIVLHEWARGIYWNSANHPAITIGVRVFITDLSLANLSSATVPAPNRSFRFNAAMTQMGPFDGDKRWLRRSNSGVAQFPLVNGETIRGGTRTNWRYRVVSSQFGVTYAHGSSAPALTAQSNVDITS